MIIPCLLGAEATTTAAVIYSPGIEGVTTAIVGFIFVCLIFPSLIRNRPQFYAAVAAVLLIILLNSVGVMFSSEGFWRFVGGVDALLQFSAILLLVLGAGGLSARELAEDVARTIEVVRRGGEKETIVVPLRGRNPKADEAFSPHDQGISNPGVQRPKPTEGSSLPLE